MSHRTEELRAFTKISVLFDWKQSALFPPPARILETLHLSNVHKHNIQLKKTKLIPRNNSSQLTSTRSNPDAKSLVSFPKKCAKTAFQQPRLSPFFFFLHVNKPSSSSPAGSVQHYSVVNAEEELNVYSRFHSSKSSAIVRRKKPRMNE